MTTFETQICSRCGGSGSYSYCQMHGTTCFGCSGTGKQLTKRGKAAAAYLRSLRTVKAGDVQFGQCVRIGSVPGFAKATYVRVETLATQLNSGKSLDSKTGEWRVHHHLHISGPTPRGEEFGLYTFPDSEVTLVPTKAEAAEQIAAAIAYQAALTKAGTVSKRKPLNTD